MRQGHLVPCSSTTLAWPLDDHGSALWITSRPTASHAGSLSISRIPPSVPAHDDSYLQLK